MTHLRQQQLRSGELRFTADVCGDGPPVLCLHGFPDHRCTWRHLLPALAEAGFRGVAPDMRGYEPISQPADGAYDLAHLTADVLAWLDQLGAGRVHLVGHDWGALVAYCVAARAPERLASLTTLAIPPIHRARRRVMSHPLALARFWYICFFQLPLLPERELLRSDGRFIRRLWRDWSPGWTCPEGDLAEVLDTFLRPGVVGASLGYYRALGRVASASGRESLRLLFAPLSMPALMLTGGRDGCVDTALYDRSARAGDLPPGSHIERLPELGHFLHLEDPPAVTRLVLDWLRAREESG